MTTKTQRGPRITTLAEIIRLAKRGKSVCRKSGRSIPAKWVAHKLGTLIQDDLQHGLFEYMPKKGK